MRTKWADMEDLEGLVIESPVYSDLAHQIEEMKGRDVTGHMVVWEAGDWSHDQGKYRILDYGEHLGEPTLLVWGHDGDREQGGKFEIIPKPDEPAWIRYYYPNDDRTKEAELTKLAVFSPDFMYENTEETASFLENPFDIINRFKEQI